MSAVDDALVLILRLCVSKRYAEYHIADTLHGRIACCYCGQQNVAFPQQGGSMIRCHLSVAMGRAKIRIIDVARETGLNRSTVAGLYKETAARVDLDTIDKLCRLFNCPVGELFEFVEDPPKTQPKSRKKKSP
jgi:putative transcriptional regulator